MTPTQRTLKALREAGAVGEVVERWNAHARVRHDLFNAFDILAIRDGAIVGIQVTSGSNVSARITKLTSNPVLVQWRGAGGLTEVHGWAKRGKRGERKRWTCRVIPL